MIVFLLNVSWFSQAAEAQTSEVRAILAGIEAIHLFDDDGDKSQEMLDKIKNALSGIDKLHAGQNRILDVVRKIPVQTSSLLEKKLKAQLDSRDRGDLLNYLSTLEANFAELAEDKIEDEQEAQKLLFEVNAEMRNLEQKARNSLTRILNYHTDRFEQLQEGIVELYRFELSAVFTILTAHRVLGFSGKISRIRIKPLLTAALRHKQTIYAIFVNKQKQMQALVEDFDNKPFPRKIGSQDLNHQRGCTEKKGAKKLVCLERHGSLKMGYQLKIFQIDETEHGCNPRSITTKKYISPNKKDFINMFGALETRHKKGRQKYTELQKKMDKLDSMHNYITNIVKTMHLSDSKS